MGAWTRCDDASASSGDRWGSRGGGGGGASSSDFFLTRVFHADKNEPFLPRSPVIRFRHRREAGAPVAMPGREEPAGAALHVRVISARDIKARARRRPHPPRISPRVSASSRPPPVALSEPPIDAHVYFPPSADAGVSREDRAPLRDRRGVRRDVQEHLQGQHPVARVGRGGRRASERRLGGTTRQGGGVGSDARVEAGPARQARRAARESPRERRREMDGTEPGDARRRG